ncbi:conjugal transfer protein TraD [Rhizobium mulingense]|uniref:conjugal transfer protein TraD n=1 Tax=Rhizobium mulingense TaxID=3031128 RepID=UPI002B486910|nr:conjugal transfer protein TraD [Rhizobium sp. MJ21]MEB3047373.1 conjugal transfer protein TraD [Rhizobium sp. MJ21]
MRADRKRDAREKFLLGGLVVKAGLSKADRAFLLGGLIELARLMPGSPAHRRLRGLGEEAFKASRPNHPPARIEETAEWP